MEESTMLSKLSRILTEERLCRASHHIQKVDSWSRLISNVPLCRQCLIQAKPHYEHFKIKRYHCLALYRYEDPLSDWLLKYKQQYDESLNEVFLLQFSWILRIIYHGYIVVPIPSTFSAIYKRGFSHLFEIVKTLHMPIIDVLRKTDGIDQKGKCGLARQHIGQGIYSRDSYRIEGKKVLVVDDVLTTGSTLKSSFDELAKAHPKTMKGLVIMKV